MSPAPAPSRATGQIALTDAVTAHNYAPLPVVVAEASSAWMTDVDGRRYLDCLAGYSALNFGHRHPALVAAARPWASTVRLGPLPERAITALLRDRVGPAWPAEESSRVTGETGGNPFWALELVAARRAGAGTPGSLDVGLPAASGGEELGARLERACAVATDGEALARQDATGTPTASTYLVQTGVRLEAEDDFALGIAVTRLLAALSAEGLAGRLVRRDLLSSGATRPGAELTVTVS